MRKGMDEKRRRFSFKKARSNMEWICPKSKGSEMPAVDPSTAGKSLCIVFSIGRSDIREVVVSLVVIEWMEVYRQIADLD